MRHQGTGCQLSVEISSHQWVLPQWNLLILGNPLRLFLLSYIESWLGFGRACTISFAGNKDIPFRYHECCFLLEILLSYCIYEDISSRVLNEETLQPTVYLNKLPEKFPEDSREFVVDPMLATGDAGEVWRQSG